MLRGCLLLVMRGWRPKLRSSVPIAVWQQSLAPNWRLMSMLLSVNLLQHLQVARCWLPTHPSLPIVGVVNSRQLMQLGVGDRLLMELHLQASLGIGDILPPACLPCAGLARRLQQTSHHSWSHTCTWTMPLPGGPSQDSQRSSSQGCFVMHEAII